MEDVYSRLFVHSIGKSPSKHSERTRAENIIHMEEESERWKLKLTAESLMEIDFPFSPTKPAKKASNSLLIRTSQTKLSSKYRNSLPPFSKLLEEAKLYSNTMHSSENLTKTPSKTVTNPFESTSFNSYKKPLLTPKRILNKREGANSTNADIKKVRKESDEEQKRRKRREKAYNLHTTIPDCDCDSMKKRDASGLIVDVDNNISVNEVPKAVPLISSTGSFWEHCGYPNSLSFILDSKKVQYNSL